MPARSTWDAKYKSAERSIPLPDPFLGEIRPFLPVPEAGAAADIACGGGRNALELAQWGFRVTAFDYSVEALRLCAERADKAGLKIDMSCVDLEAPVVDLGSERFEVVSVFNYLHRPLIPILKRCVRPGGIIVYKTYTRKQLQFGTGPKNPDFLLHENELPQLFDGFRHLLYRETCESEATAALLAQRL